MRKLTPTNTAANAINEARLKAIKRQVFTYKASLEGKVPTAPAEEELKLKKAARVVVIANIYQEENGLVAANGDTGDVVELDDKSIKVKIDRTGETVKIPRHTWESIAYTWANGKLEKEVVGKIATPGLGHHDPQEPGHDHSQGVSRPPRWMLFRPWSALCCTFQGHGA